MVPDRTCTQMWNSLLQDCVHAKSLQAPKRKPDTIMRDKSTEGYKHKGIPEPQIDENWKSMLENYYLIYSLFLFSS